MFICFKHKWFSDEVDCPSCRRADKEIFDSIFNPKKTYTLKDLEDAFNAAREMKPLKTFADPSPGQTQIKYISFQDYLNTLKP